MDCSRYVFNQTIAYIRYGVNYSPSWMEIKKDLLKQLPSWCEEVPFLIKCGKRSTSSFLESQR